MGGHPPTARAGNRHPAWLRHRLSANETCLRRRTADERGQASQPVSIPVGPASRLCDAQGLPGPRRTADYPTLVAGRGW